MKSKHAKVTSGPQIVVVDVHNQVHIQPAANKKSVEGYNSKLPKEKRSKIYDFDEAHPELSYYLALAKKSSGSAESSANDFAAKKVIEQNNKLQTTVDKQADEIKKLKAQLQEKNNKNPAAEAAAK